VITKTLGDMGVIRGQVTIKLYILLYIEPCNIYVHSGSHESVM
jgi:hypothetical protein